MPHIRHTKAVAAMGAAALVALLATAPTPARAATMDELQQQVQDSGQAYDQAQQRVDDLQQQIDQNEQRIQDIEAQLPDKRQKAADSIRTLYKMQQDSQGLIGLLLSSEDFESFLATLQYLDVIQASNSDAVQELVSLDQELEDARTQLAQQMDEAQTKKDEAQQSLQSAIDARTQLEQEMAAQAAAEEAARQAAQQQAEEAAAKAAQQDADKAGDAQEADDTSLVVENTNTDTGQTTTVTTPAEAPSNSSASTVDWQNDKASFVATWGARIDAYMAGYPLAGYGKVFAEAAWNYGVDPRLSPAISCIESGKGRACFRPHNAWGWGNVGWSSWEEAINGHVKGLAQLYGGHLTYAGAKMYATVNVDQWYALVLAEMERI